MGRVNTHVPAMKVIRFFLLIIIILLTSITASGCQPRYTQWYIENRLPDALFINGPFTRVILLAPCSATYVSYYNNHIAETFDQATDFSLKINTTNIQVPQDFRHVTALNDSDMIQLVISDTQSDSCPEAINGVYQVKVQNDSKNKISVLVDNLFIGYVDPLSTGIVGPIEGIITWDGLDLLTNEEKERVYGFDYGDYNWKLGEIPTLTLTRRR
jgi:hypothetical protein